jgi:aspartyl/asparaginyl-tRNA synthetase
MEITTAAQREHRYDVLLRQAAEKGLNPIRDATFLFRGPARLTS